MDTKETQEGFESCSKRCPCHGMGGGMYGHHHLGHVVLRILVALFIFWCGVQFGELKGMLTRGYSNYGMMGAYGEGGQWYRGGPSMMYGSTYGTVPQTTATTSRK